MPPESKIAVETVGNWYGMVDEMERAGHVALLTNAGKAKAMMGQMMNVKHYSPVASIRNVTEESAPCRGLLEQPRPILQMRFVHRRQDLLPSRGARP